MNAAEKQEERSDRVIHGKLGAEGIYKVKSSSVFLIMSPLLNT